MSVNGGYSLVLRGGKDGFFQKKHGKEKCGSERKSDGRTDREGAFTFMIPIFLGQLPAAALQHGGRLGCRELCEQ